MKAALRAVETATGQVTHSIVVVTPEMAKRWLAEHNTHNRPISETRVAQYIADMESGRWTFNGETIQFDKHGVLLNGQHRLMAIIATGIAQTFLIVRGLDRSSQITMDQGTRRNPKDQLQIAGIVTDNTVAAAIRTYLLWRTGRLFGDQVRNKITTSEVVEWAIGNPDLVDLLRDLTTAGVRRAKCNPSTALAIALRFALIDEAECLQFFGRLISAEGMKGSILALHRRLSNARENDVRLTTRDTIGYFVTAWNAWREGRSMTKLQKPRGGSWTFETFPEPK